MRTRALALAVLLLPGCPADDSSADGDTGGMDNTEEGADTAPVGQCSDTSENSSVYDPPGECYNNTNCPSCNCVTFQDNPPSADSMCGEAGTGMMRVTATVWTFPDQTPITNQAIRVVGATDIGLNGPENAETIAESTTDAQGRFDVMLTPTDQIGIVAIVQADGFHDTATGLAKPEANGYEAANAIHDVFVVPAQTLADYSATLEADAEAAEHLPLGENGGVVGIVRNRYTGEPQSGIQIASLNGVSSAVIRYLNADGTWGTDATSETGVYAILNPVLAEEFEAQMGGAVVSTRPNKAGSGPPGIFTMNLTVDVDPGSNPFE